MAQSFHLEPAAKGKSNNSAAARIKAVWLRAYLTDPAQVIAQQVHNHQIFSLVLL